jgi:FkbM family methyltransferase
VTVVLDTNVLLVSIPKTSKHRLAFDAFLAGKFDLAISNEVLSEYTEIAEQHTNHSISSNLAELLTSKSKMGSRISLHQASCCHNLKSQQKTVNLKAMLNFIKRKIRKYRLKTTFKEYGFEITKINLGKDGVIDYATWLHPLYKTEPITQIHVDFYRQFITEGGFAIDVGAHQGDTTVPMAIAAGKSGLILALEPNPHVYPALVENAKLNPDKIKIIPLPFAATATDGEFTFGSGDAAFGNGGIVGFSTNKASNVRYTFNVTGKNLEKYIGENYSAYLPQLQLIKTDAEGYDKEILKTLQTYLKKYRPAVISECFSQLKPSERFELFDIFDQQQYDVYYLDGQENKPSIKIERHQMTNWKHFDIIGLAKEKSITS